MPADSAPVVNLQPSKIQSPAPTALPSVSPSLRPGAARSLSEGPATSPGPSIQTQASQSSGETERWRKAVDFVRQASPRHGASLSHARFGGFTPEGRARIGFSSEHAFHRSSVLGTGRALIEEALAKALGRPTQLLEDSSAQALASAPKSIAEEETAVRVARENTIDHKVRAHPAVRAVERLLRGTLEHVQVLEAVKPERSLEPALADQTLDESER